MKDIKNLNDDEIKIIIYYFEKTNKTMGNIAKENDIEIEDLYRIIDIYYKSIGVEQYNRKTTDTISQLEIQLLLDKIEAEKNKIYTENERKAREEKIIAVKRQKEEKEREKNEKKKLEQKQKVITLMKWIEFKGRFPREKIEGKKGYITIEDEEEIRIAKFSRFINDVMNHKYDEKNPKKFQEYKEMIKVLVELINENDESADFLSKLYNEYRYKRLIQSNFRGEEQLEKS